jgi:hypothetical protein
MARILFVDDDPYTLEALGKAVEVFGHQAVWAKDGKEAIAIATAGECTLDIVFVDMSLPDIDGLDLVSRLRDIPELSSTPMMVLSANPAVDAADLARKAGAQAYLNKPVRLQTLLDTIHTYTTT